MVFDFGNDCANFSGVKIEPNARKKSLVRKLGLANSDSFDVFIRML